MRNPTIDAIVRLERWMAGAVDAPLLQGDVRLVIDTLREAEGLAIQLTELENKYLRLAGELDALAIIVRRVGPRVQ